MAILRIGKLRRGGTDGEAGVLVRLRIEVAAAASGVDVDWRPFLLGPIFRTQGWQTSPFNLYPAKGRYMVRDLTRVATHRGLPFHVPTPFPANSLAAARLALFGKQDGWCQAFSHAVFTAGFARAEDIANVEILRRILSELGVDPEAAVMSASSPEHKARLRQETELATTRGIFGAPSFVTADGELFWGDDRLEQALAWANRQ